MLSSRTSCFVVSVKVRHDPSIVPPHSEPACRVVEIGRLLLWRGPCRCTAEKSIRRTDLVVCLRQEGVALLGVGLVERARAQSNADGVARIPHGGEALQSLLPISTRGGLRFLRSSQGFLALSKEGRGGDMGDKDDAGNAGNVGDAGDAGSDRLGKWLSYLPRIPLDSLQRRLQHRLLRQEKNGTGINPPAGISLECDTGD